MTPARRLSERVDAIKGSAARAIRWHRQADLLQVRELEGFLSRKKATLLYDTVRGLEPRGALAEVGSWKGKSTVAIALAMQRAGLAGPLYAIDHHEGSEEHAEVIEAQGSTWPVFQQTVREAGVESLKSISDTVRVDIRKLDELMNLVGELVIQRGAIGELLSRLLADPSTARVGQDLSKVYKALDRKLRGLQAAVLDIGNVPRRPIQDRDSR